MHSKFVAVSAFLASTLSPAHAATPAVAVGPQCGSTHVYVASADLDRFAASFVATFGGIVHVGDSAKARLWLAG